MRERYDMAVIGAGPAGLHAALKAAVLKQTVLLVDKGRKHSRVSQAPAIANLPGTPGISGLDLLERGRRDLEAYRRLSGQDLVTVAEDTEVSTIDRLAEGYRLVLTPVRHEADGPHDDAPGGAPLVVEARTVVLATGLVDRKPGVSRHSWHGQDTLAPYVHRGKVGYCVLCEGWSLDGARVAVLGQGEDAAHIAQDLRRHFGAEVKLLSIGGRDGLEAAHDGGVTVDPRPVRTLRDAGKLLEVQFEDGTSETFDKAILHLGFYKINSELAAQVGAKLTDEGYVVTNEDCEALDAEGRPVRGFFAIGDVRDNRWKQIVIAWGEAERAVITAYAYRLPD